MNSKLLRFLWLVAFVVGLFAVAARFVLGKDLAAYNSYVPWGLWVAVYLYFVGISAGLFMVGAIAWGFRLPSLAPVRRLVLFLAGVTLIGGLVTIVQDLGRPFRAWKVLLQPNFSSMMAWMIWMYMAYLLLLVVIQLVAFRERLSGRPRQFADDLSRRIGANDEDTVVRRLVLLGLPLTIAFSGGVGALFGVVGARPVWNSALMPLLFVAGALASGSAVLTAVVSWFWEERNGRPFRDLLRTLSGMMLGFLALYLLFEWAEFSINLYASIPAHADAFRLVLFGPYWWVFWLVHLGLGSLLPLALLARQADRESPTRVGIAASLIAITFLAVRVNIVIPGLALEELHGLGAAYRDSRLHFDYFPNLWEWGVAIFAYTLVALLFHLGARYLPLLGRPTTSTETRS